MMRKLNHLRVRAKGEERGSAEIITTMIMLPIILWLIFSMIDISLYLNARSKVTNLARDGARAVAIYGGDDSRLNPYGKTIASDVKSRLWNGSKCSASACRGAPVVTCTPTVTNSAGQPVSCTIRYSYKSIYASNPITGFAGFLNKDFTVTEHARAETGF